MRGFTQDERAAFLRFVWGRSRLPPPTEFDRNFEIHDFPKKEAGMSEDEYLPETHTCFFQLNLPRYSSLELMRQKLLFAIENCRSIDTDFAVQDAELEDDAETW